MPLFKRRKPAPVVVLSVVDRENQTKLGVLEVLRGQKQFRRQDRLRVLSISSTKHHEEMKIFINGDQSASTVKVRNGNFVPNQVLLVDAIHQG